MKFQCEHCGSSFHYIHRIKLCGNCEKEGCIDCTQFHRIVDSERNFGTINTWIHWNCR